MSNTWLYPGQSVVRPWSSARYALNNRIASLDKDAAGITFSQDGDVIVVTVAAGTGPHAAPVDGAYRFWDARDSFTGRTTRFDVDAQGGFNGECSMRLDIMQGIGQNSGIELSWGWATGSAAANQQNMFCLFDTTNPTIVAWRYLASALTRTVAAAATGNARGVFGRYNHTIAGNPAFPTPGTSAAFGIRNQDEDPVFYSRDGSNFDFAFGSGNTNGMMRYLAINVRVVGSATAAQHVYHIRPRALIADWRRTQ